ncbi:MAG: hypothetical protein D6681_21315 [Calditrichaeota bacterium]|nr:MAG: hypothetical protein D6681_21315 [Calditrichota bacterium]
MNRKLIILSLVPLALILLLAAYFLFRDTSPPPPSGEKGTSSRVILLENFQQLAGRFNADSNRVRIIALVSPTCPVCGRGFYALQKLLADVPDERLQVYIVMMPIFPEDEKGRGEARAGELRDPRVLFYWDPDRISGNTWKEVLGLDQLAVELYFLYRPGVTWEFDPTAPDFWMRQLSGVIQAPFLDIERLKAEVRRALSETSG